MLSVLEFLVTCKHEESHAIAAVRIIDGRLTNYNISGSTV
jgi:hypothetical protein